MDSNSTSYMAPAGLGHSDQGTPQAPENGPSWPPAAARQFSTSVIYVVEHPDILMRRRRCDVGTAANDAPGGWEDSDEEIPQAPK